MKKKFALSMRFATPSGEKREFRVFKTQGEAEKWLDGEIEQTEHYRREMIPLIAPFLCDAVIFPIDVIREYPPTK